MFPTPIYKTHASAKKARKGWALSAEMTIRRLKVWCILVAAFAMIGTAGQAVAQTAPTIVSVITTPLPGNEGDTVTVTITISDPDSVQWYYYVDFLGDGSWLGDHGSWSNNTTEIFTWTYNDDFNKVINVAVYDDVLPLPVYSNTPVTISNVAPTILSVVNNCPQDEDNPVTVTIQITDPGTADTWNYYADWNDDGDYGDTDESMIGSSNTSEVLSHTYDNGFNQTINVMVEDDDGGQILGSTSITVNDVNDPPVADDESFTVAEGGTATEADLDAGTGLLAGDTDVDLPGDTLTVNTTPVTPPTNGALTLNADGTFSYVHDGTETTTDSFEYEVSDGNGGT
ncbi:MAG: cadherin-like domain-containing protein, partial [Deltaproteobacteria bacterium]|nr:cadherin-like domain-containing protein [Deltaproteobacteria bacterium]